MPRPGNVALPCPGRPRLYDRRSSPFRRIAMLTLRSKRKRFGSRTLATAFGRATRGICGGLLMTSVVMQDGTAAAEKFKAFKMKSLEGAQKSLSDVLGKATLVVFF